MKIEEIQQTNCTELEDGGLFKGLIFGALLSIPLWMSFFGWVKIISKFT